MFKQKKCPNCHMKVEDVEESCPYCDHEFKKRTNRVTYLPFWKQITIFGIGLLGFQIIGALFQVFVLLIAKVVLKDQTSLEQFAQSALFSAIINFTIYAILFVILMSVLWTDNIKILKSFKNWRIPIAAVVGYLAIFMFNLIYTNILSGAGITIHNNQNETSLREIIALYPALSFIIFALVGPICEELTYRVGLYSFFRRKNKYVAYAVTILIFTFIHFDFTTTDWANELLNVPYYLFAAFTFSFIYEKFGFAASMSSHIINNSVSIIATIITVFSKK